MRHFLAMQTALHRICGRGAPGRGANFLTSCPSRGSHRITGIRAAAKLYDVPVSNNGARVRFIIYKKGLEKEYAILKPDAIGGLKVNGPSTRMHAAEGPLACMHS